MGFQTLIAGTIFISVYAVIISEKFNRASTAILGAVFMVLIGIVTETQAVSYIDFGTIGLLMGMMIIVNIMKKTGVFEYVAIKSAKLAKADPWVILVFFSVITAISSALLDNVTTILLIAPVTFVITETLKVDPIPYILTEVLFANIGGTATLIGDPPNIMIGSANNIGFMAFLTNLGPVVFIISVMTLLILHFTLGKKLHVEETSKKKVMLLDESKVIRDKVLLVQSLIVMFVTIIGFMLHDLLHLHSATVAMSGAAILLFISGSDPEDIFMEIEWTTIFFFVALFILVGGLEEAGIIHIFAEKILNLTKGNIGMTTMVLLWGSAILSAFLDNIPFVATMIPLIQNIQQLGGMDVMSLWWALALGACLGGNGTMIGASANVIACGMLEKKTHKIGFLEYMKFAFPLMIVSILISTVYLLLFYV